MGQYKHAAVLSEIAGHPLITNVKCVNWIKIINTASPDMLWGVINRRNINEHLALIAPQL